MFILYGTLVFQCKLKLQLPVLLNGINHIKHALTILICNGIIFQINTSIIYPHTSSTSSINISIIKQKITLNNDSFK